MSLLSLEVRTFRNLSTVNIRLSQSLTLVYGGNGSGKTSLLEAVHLLAQARSFRSPKAAKYIQSGSQSTVVFGTVNQFGTHYRLGVEKTISDQTRIQINGERQSIASSLASKLPLQLITPDSFTLLLGEPRERRAYVDSGLFHVEHDFLEVSKKYRRLLDQRNAALKRQVGLQEINVWEEDLAFCGERIAQMRENYICALQNPFAFYFRKMLEMKNVPRFILRKGWMKERSLIESLQQNRSAEYRSGFTMSGPHRADLRLIMDTGEDVADHFSRGQQKLTVSAMKLAQMELLHELDGRRSLLMVDDLAAELDRKRRGLFLEAISVTSAQCLVTSTSETALDLSSWTDKALFHVEHGTVREVI